MLNHHGRDNHRCGDWTDSPFEEQVVKELRDAGLHVRTQVGFSGFRIDLALVDPEQPDRFVIGIECDGATYHRSATARDRDRLRQDVLEGLGWHIIRIWSTDWMMDQQKQVRRVRDFYEQNLRARRSPEVPAPQDSSTDDEDEVPAIIQPPQLAQYNYTNIDKVPWQVIAGCIKEQYTRQGKMPREDIRNSVARQLGFAKTGTNIKKRLDTQIDSLLQSKEIELVG
ncbi:MAG: DUF559 domain-containing protein [Thermoguttaceae bacterium]